MTSICIDGFNLALSKGTGIATYGRNLLVNARQVGFGTQVLYGPPRVRMSADVVNEAMLTDAERQPGKLTRKAKLQRFRRTALSQLGREAYGIAPSSEVIWSTRGGGRPAADAFWAAQSLFTEANRCFAAYGSGTPVRFREGGGVSKPDVVHWTATLPLHAKDAANVYTIHDLIPLRLPHTTLDDKSRYMDLCREVARRADQIAVVSETTRQDVIRLLGVDEARITNTYQAVNLPTALTSRSDGDVQLELEGVFNLPWKGYFLHYGAIEPKKNLGRIVEAYLASGVRLPLVLVGGAGWLEDGETALLKQIKRDGGPSADRIRQYDYMPFSLLLSLIRGARSTLFPSLYEGFGLPVLESMALSTSVLTSSAGSLPEVAGDAAYIVDPYDVQAMTRGLRVLAEDDDLDAELVSRGRSQVERFTPARYQERLASLYAKVGVTP